MSGEHAKRELMITGEKPGSSGKKNEEKTPSKEAGHKHKEEKDESTGSIKSYKKGNKKKKKIKKVVYYETDSSSPSTSDVESTSSKRQERKKYSKAPLHYHRISKRAPLHCIPLGKPPYFDGEESRRIEATMERSSRILKLKDFLRRRASSISSLLPTHLKKRCCREKE
jgi:hypothetical protein